MCWSRFLLFVFSGVAAVIAVSCETEAEDLSGVDDLKKLELRLSLSQGYVADVRSVLQENTIENKMTDATLASYDSNGRLVNTLYYSCLDDSMLLYVSGARPNNIYVLVNMGDMTGEFPENEAHVENMMYRVDSYERVALKGIPMCGVLKGCSPQDGKVVTMSLERLFAKLSVRILHTGLTGGQTSTCYAYNLANRSLYLRQANRKLLPFATEGSRAVTPADVLDLSDCNPDLADLDEYQGSLKPADFGPGMAYVKDTTVILYVPENVQGCLLPGNTDPFAKVAGNISDIEGKSYEPLCTYLEYNASKPNRGDGYYGDLTYRCYLGEDDVSDFSIRRNCIYDLTMNFTDAGFVLDNWKVVRGDNWMDVRTLCFVDAPFLVYPGTTVNVPLHYNRATSSLSTGSSGSVGDLVFEYDDEAMRQAGVVCTFMGNEKVTGENGYMDYYFKVEASSDALVGASFPIKASLRDGAKADCAMLYVAEIDRLNPVWDYCPQYVSQTGELVFCGALDAMLPLTVEVSDDSVVECVRTGADSFRFTAVKEGDVEVAVSNSDGSQTARLSMHVSAPTLKVYGASLALNPDGGKKRVSYVYVDDDGVPLTNIDAGAYVRYLKPVLSGCDHVSADVTDSYMDVYISKLNSGGIPLSAGGDYRMSVGAVDCPGVDSHTIQVHVVDPFENTGTGFSASLDDYTLLDLPGVPEVVRNKFAAELSDKLDFIYEMPPVDADEIFVSSSFEPIWKGEFCHANGVYRADYCHRDDNSSKGASISLTQNIVTESTPHGAGLHELKLHVRNRHSGEYISKIFATVEVYVHTVIGASAVFGYMTCDSPSGGANGTATVAGIYNALAGSALYKADSPDRIYYMDVSMEYLTPVDGVLVFEGMIHDALTGYNLWDGLDWITPSKSDGELDMKQRLLYSVCVGGGQRVAVCNETYGYRRGVGSMLYRALALNTSSGGLTESQLKQTFLGYSSVYGGGLALYSPSYDIHDMNVGDDDRYNIVYKGGPYYFSPRSCAGYRDARGRGYHVIHPLESLVPSSSGWINLL